MNDIELLPNPRSNNPIDDYTEVKPSNIHGLGLFARKFIPKDTIWWNARPKDVLVITKDQFLNLDSSHKNSLIDDFIHNLLHYSYYDNNLDALIFSLDNSRFVNHSFSPNSGGSKDGYIFSVRAIKIFTQEKKSQRITQNIHSVLG